MYEEKIIERKSLCRVLALDDNGVRKLKRLGDIDIEGKIITYDFDPDKPRIFDNRIHIFWKDGPEEEGFVGIWDWSAQPNKVSIDKDYIESHYCQNESPIEIIEISKANSIDELVKYNGLIN